MIEKTGNPFDYETGVVHSIDIRLIQVEQNAIFRDFNDKEKRERLDELKESIRKNGLLENLIVYPVLTGFKLIAGYRRYTACSELGLDRVNCLVVEEEKVPEVLIEENEKREDLDFIEQAECYLYVLDEHKIDQRELAQRLNRSDTFVSNMISVAKLGKDMKKQIRDSQYFSKSVILEVLRLNEKGAVPRTIKHLASNPLPVKKLRTFIKEVNEKKPEETPQKAIKKAQAEIKDQERLDKKTRQIDSWFKRYEDRLEKMDLREIMHLRRRAELFLRHLRERGYTID